MNLIFIGTTEFAVPSLRRLALDSDLNIAAIFTQPPRPKGRGRKIKPTAVELAALELALPIFPAENINEPALVQKIKALKPDFIIVIAFGQKIGAEILAVPPNGTINLHASLLPSYRGANPIQRAMLNGEKETGVTTMLMDVDWDSGPILLQEKIDIEDNNFGQLAARLADLGAELLLKTIKNLQKGNLTPQKQDKNAVTAAPKLKKNEMIIDWSADAEVIARQIRSLNPFPLARTFYEDIEARIISARKIEGNYQGQIGEIVLANPQDGLIVQTGAGLLGILEIQIPGRKKLEVKTFLRGFNMEEGKILKGGKAGA